MTDNTEVVNEYLERTMDLVTAAIGEPDGRGFMSQMVGAMNEREAKLTLCATVGSFAGTLRCLAPVLGMEPMELVAAFRMEEM